MAIEQENKIKQTIVDKRNDSTDIALNITVLGDEPVTKELVQSDKFSKYYRQFKSLCDKCKEVEDNLKKELKAFLQEQFIQLGDQKIESTEYTITYVPAGTKTSFDTESFKRDYPDLYKKYVKVSQTSAAIRITEKKNPNGGDGNA